MSSYGTATPSAMPSAMPPSPEPSTRAMSGDQVSRRGRSAATAASSAAWALMPVVRSCRLGEQVGHVLPDAAHERQPVLPRQKRRAKAVERDEPQLLEREAEV